MLAICAVLIFFLLATLIVVQRIKFLRVVGKVPQFPGALPLIGHGLHFVGGHDAAIKFIVKASYMANKLNGVVTLWMGPKPLYLITDTQIAYKVSNACLEKSYMYKFSSSWLGEGLITASVPVWKKHRKLLNPAFNQLVLNGFMGIFNKESVVVVEKLKEHVGKGRFDHWPPLMQYGLGTVTQTAVGLPPTDKDYIESRTYSKAINGIHSILLRRMSNVFLHSKWIWNMTPIKREENTHAKVLQDVAANVLEARKKMQMDDIDKNIKQNGPTRFSERKIMPFLDQMLDLQAQGLLSDQEIMDELNTIIAAGHDTSSSTLCFTMILLGSHKDVQEKIYDEIVKNLGAELKNVEQYELSKLVYMEAVLKETLRYIPLVPIVLRDALEDVHFDTFTIPSGSTIVISLYGLSRSKEIWGDDVEQFNPERWMDPLKLPDHPAVFPAFSFGKRGCIGKMYSFMSMKTTLVHLLRKYRISSDISKFRTQFSVIVKPLTGHHISIERR